MRGADSMTQSSIRQSREMALSIEDRCTRGTIYSQGSSPYPGHLALSVTGSHSCWLGCVWKWPWLMAGIRGEHEQGQVRRQRGCLQGAVFKNPQQTRTLCCPSQTCFWQQHIGDWRLTRPWTGLLGRLQHALVWSKPSNSWGSQSPLLARKCTLGTGLSGSYGGTSL